ncbi:MAG: phosphate acyltransferase PlsX [Spirochaetia bacterium]|nr:phosphate acyltransferase PlsX [Spirochaetia bacterium]
MRIALDVMGGDNAPNIEVEGAIAAVRQKKDVIVILVGKKELIEARINAGKPTQEERSRLEIVNANEVITMHDHPAQAYKQKTDSSLVVAAALLNNNTADALISAGNTGAVLVTSLLGIVRIHGVLRPAIATPMPSACGTTILLDGGANVDCKPEHLAQFAIMGNLYSKHIFDIASPRVGVLSVGEEEGKGNEISLLAKNMISGFNMNFLGNVEGREVFNGKADVVVCDGFVGNVVLKAAEGLATFLLGEIKSNVKKSGPLAMLGAFLLTPVFNAIKNTSDPNEYGGAPLLGIKKPVIISHGSSSATGIKNAILVADKCVTKHINDEILEEIRKAEVKGE